MWRQLQNTDRIFLSKRTSAERIADEIVSFAESYPFVAVYLLVFCSWILLNSVPTTRAMHFETFPYPLMDTIVALEAILLSSFILMRQSRSDPTNETTSCCRYFRFTEKEVSAVVRMNQQIAEQVGLRNISKGREIRELGQPTSIDEVAQTIQGRLSNE
jgi:uncharacterized membrane protein